MSHHKYPRTYHFPWSLGTTSDWFRDTHGIEIQHGLKIPNEAIIAAKGKLDHKSQRYCFYLYRETNNPRIMSNDFRHNDYYQCFNMAIEKALEFI
jgi:hypothetical protein